MKNRRVVEQDNLEREKERQIRQAKAEALHARVQAERRETEGRHILSVNACKDEKRQQSQSDRMMLQTAIDVAADQLRDQIETKVRLAKFQAAGRVAAARERVLAEKRASRKEVASDQKFALDEKARRLQALREEHAQAYANKFEEWASEDAMSEVARYLVRSRMPTASQHLRMPSVSQVLALRDAEATPGTNVNLAATAAGGQ